MKKKVIAALLCALMFVNSVPATQVSAAVYEAEQAVTDMAVQRPENPGDYSGDGYLEVTDATSKAEFTVTVGQAGNYAVDVRYSNSENRAKLLSVYVNDEFVKETQMPKTVNADTYAVLTESLPLKAGENKIKFQMGGKAETGADTLEVTDISTGPLYWMAYESPFEQDHYLEEDRWDKNADWMVSQGFVEAGYQMMSTDGWVEGAQVINENGYVTKYNYSWDKTWKGMADQLKEKGMTLGVYYDPLWVTAAAFHSDAKIVGTEFPVSGLVNDAFGHFSNFKPQDVPKGEGFDGETWCKKGEPALYWLDTDRPGAEEYVKGYVKHFADAGATFLRVDFLGWYENGIGGDNKQNGKPAYGTERYETALRWMREACDEHGVMLSLVMPNQYNHAEVELKYGHMMRVNEDVANGGWDSPQNGPEMGWPNNHISGRRRGQWQKDWAQWGNSFDAFTGWADVGGRGQMVLDGDFLRMARFDVVKLEDNSERKLTAEEAVTADAQKRSAVSLAAMAGSPICIADQFDTMNKNAPEGVDNKKYYLNEEILDLNKAGFVAKPIRLGESERWAGQLSDGSWVVGLFNRDRTVKTQFLDFKEDLGIVGNAAVRELWQHRDYGQMDGFMVDLNACDCVVLKITPDSVRYEAEVASLRDGANSNNNHGNFSGWGFADKLEKGGGDVLFAVNASGTKDIQIRYCNGNKDDDRLPVAGVYVNGQKVRDVNLPSTGDWDTWGTVTVEGVEFAQGENLVDIQCVGKAGFNLDYIEIGEAKAAPGKKIQKAFEAEAAIIGSGAKIASDHQLAYDGRFVDNLNEPHWSGSNDTLKFTVKMEEEGDYDLSFRYANGGGDATADIFVNGKKLGYFTFPTVYQGAWDTWGVVTLHEAQKEDGEGIELEKVHLNAGENTIEYKHGNNALNMDRLTITAHEAETARIVKSVEAFEAIEVKTGTPFAKLNLPEKANITVEGEDAPVAVAVVWNEAGIRLDTAGTYTLTGDLQLGAQIANPEGLKAQIVVHVKDGETKPDPSRETKVIQVKELAAVEASKGTAFEKLSLPKTAEVTLEDGTKAVLNITWNGETYDAQKAGTYTLQGELLLKEGIINPDGIKAKITVIVKDGQTVPAGEAKIVKVGSLAGISAVVGTAFEKLALPKTVIVDLDNKSSETLEIVWSKDGYNAQKEGSYTLSGELKLKPGIINPGRLQAKIAVTLKEGVQEGKVYTVGDYRYKVTSTSKKTVSAVGTKKKTIKKIAVPDTVKLNGKKFKVTEVGASAFKSCKKAASVKIGNNVTVIGNNAFYGCQKVKQATLSSKNLKSIGSKAFYNCKALSKMTIQSTALKKVGSKAFAKTAKKITIKVPSKKKAAYKRLFKNKGLSKSAKIK